MPVPVPKLTLRTAGLIIADAIRSLSGPSVFDMRPTRITIVKRVHSGGQRGDGRVAETNVLVLPPYTRVRQVSEREIASSGGLYEEGDLIIGPITPGYIDLHGHAQGFTQAMLIPRRDLGVEYLFRFSRQAGETGIVGDSDFVDFKRDKNLRFEIVVGRLRTTPGP